MKGIHTLKISTEKNAIKREIMNLQLMENIAVAKKIRDSIPLKIKNTEQRGYLEMVIKNHVLELQNIELEIHLQIQEKSIMDLKNICDSQKLFICSNGLGGGIGGVGTPNLFSDPVPVNNLNNHHINNNI